ncbi:MAG: glycoside hydrolase TIM-barrel-like domain-containing protein [Pseudomonadota bacterium]|nr:glycoside hydrolase TIM-barrel-like domain-containing protein [Pseudomonadota bacterium]
MPILTGVHLLPATGEFTYDTIAYLGQRVGEPALAAINTYAGGGARTDYSIAIDQLQAQHPECRCVSVVCAWFCDGLTAGSCHVYPSTTYIGGAFAQAGGGADVWRCSGLTQTSAGLIGLPSASHGGFAYGGTPSDPSIVRCLRDLKARGFKVVFYPFLLMTAPGLPWRGQISYAPDLTAAATTAVNAFLGGAAAAQFTRDAVNLTVGYAGAATDWTYRRMILHYANLCVLAGGVDLFVIGSELRGLESVRGPGWTKAGTVDGAGHAVWDYPFVAGLAQLASDVRGVFDGAGLTRNLGGLSNLIAYSADWSVWMGFQHPGANGQWPHLDALYASPAVDFVAFDNYLPLSDWTTGMGGLDAVNWQAPPPAGWPPPSPATRGFGLTGAPTLLSPAYLKANIEGGEKFDLYYNDSNNLGAGDDPLGSGLMVSRPEGDRATQTRSPYYPGQQILANKQIRWWWNNPHRAIYDAGSGWAPQGPATAWIAQSKPIVFLEYGVPAVDKGTNQPNLFYAPGASGSGTPYWSIWSATAGGGLAPLRDDTLPEIALDAIHDYWQANNASVAGVAMIQWTFSCVWNWDARPFPTFPNLSSVWGDAANWAYGDWQGAGRMPTPPITGSPDPAPGVYPLFPALATLGWSVHVRPRFLTEVAAHVSGRESRANSRALAIYDIELNYDALRADAHAELQAIAGFYARMAGRAGAFWLAPPGLASVVGQGIGTGDGVTTSFALTRSWAGYVEPAQATSGVAAVYLNGVAQGVGWSVTPGFHPAINFAAAPAPGVAVSADFGVLWLCRFAEDVADLENFMALLWRWRTLKLQTVRP